MEFRFSIFKTLWTFLLVNLQYEECSSYLVNHKYLKTSSLNKFASPTSTDIRIENNFQVQIEVLNHLNNIPLINIQDPHEKATAFINPLYNKFISAWRNAINGSFTDLCQITDLESKWDNPFVSTFKEYLEGMTKFSSYFMEPSLDIFSAKRIDDNKFQIEYQLSFFYPMPWRPRIIIPGTAIIETANKNNRLIVNKVIENWDYKVFELFKQQFVPRFWDVFHLFNTPSPEYPPYKVLGEVGPVEFIEVSPTLQLEVRWRGLANQPGPPLQVIPDFSLFGNLKTSKMNREPFYTVLPSEVQSGRYTCPTTGNDMKQSSWFFHVPTNCRNNIMNRIPDQSPSSYTPINLNVKDSESNESDPNENEIDYAVGYENIAVMPSLSKGTLRGNYELNTTLIEEIRANEKVDYIYKYTPKRVLARTSIRGNVETNKITKAFTLLKAVIENKDNVKNICKKKGILKLGNPLSKSLDSLSIQSNPNNWIGLQHYNTKVCFNSNGQPGMAIYEIQFQSKLTKVYIELEFE